MIATKSFESDSEIMPSKPPVEADIHDNDVDDVSKEKGQLKGLKLGASIQNIDLKKCQEKLEGMAWLLQIVTEKVLRILFIVTPVLFDWIKAAHYYYVQLPPKGVQFLIGFVFCFFGGTFPTLFAAIEAAEQGGRKQVQGAVTELAEEAMFIIEENKKDDQLDEDHNGIRDVLEISKEELFQRKTKLVLTKMNPEKMDKALYSMYKVWMVVAAVLQIKFARVISFSLSIAEFLEKPCKRFIEPVVREAVPDEYAKWVPVIMGWAIKSFAMSIAWQIQTIFSAVQSAVKGGLLMARAIYEYCIEQNWEILGPLPKNHQETYMDEVLSVIFALWGFTIQFGNSFKIPFPWNIVFLPFTIAEWWIRWTITSR